MKGKICRRKITYEFMSDLGTFVEVYHGSTKCGSQPATSSYESFVLMVSLAQIDVYEQWKLIQS